MTRFGTLRSSKIVSDCSRATLLKSFAGEESRYCWRSGFIRLYKIWKAGIHLVQEFSGRLQKPGYAGARVYGVRRLIVSMVKHYMLRFCRISDWSIFFLTAFEWPN
jgi:hypothetical protein